jgi:hypothetical protein
MPEAAIDEDSDSLRAEYHIGPPSGARENNPIDSIAQTRAVQRSSERDLGGCIALTRGKHAVSSFDRRRHWGF